MNSQHSNRINAMSSVLNSKGAEWVLWIETNLQRGCTPASMVEKMLPTWTETDAYIAISTAQARINRRTVNRPLIRLTSNFIECGDRNAQILFALKSPHIVLIDNILSKTECGQLVELAGQKGLLNSCVVDPDTGNSVDHFARTSRGCSFTRSENPLCQTIETRLSTISEWPPERAEGLQILQYKHGQEYRPHFDWFDPAKTGSAKHLIRGGQRVGTFVLYLTDVEEGGSTIFPNIGVEVFPKKGSAVFFSDVDEYGTPNPDTFHGGSPVIKGTKIISTYWQRERNY